MKKMHFRLWAPVMIALFMVLLPTQVTAQDSPSISDLSWMAGNWSGEMEGGVIEEYWSRPSGNTIMGMFSLVKGENPVFYEFMVIEKNDDGLVMYLRHFNPKSIAWEDKQSPMVFSTKSISGNEAVFVRTNTGSSEKLIYKLDSQDKLTVILEKEKDGKKTRSEFIYKRSE